MRRTLPSRRVLTVGTLAVAAALAGGGIAYAATNSGGSAHHAGVYAGEPVSATVSPIPAPGAGHDPDGAPGGMHRPHPHGFGRAGAARLGRGLLHGTVVRRTNAAGTATETDAFQVGTVTAVSASALKVTSTDGFAGSYVLNSGTHYGGRADTSGSAPTVGEKVVVRAVEKDGTDTATNVRPQPVRPLKPRRPESAPAAPPAPTAPSSSASGSSTT